MPTGFTVALALQPVFLCLLFLWAWRYKKTNQGVPTIYATFVALAAMIIALRIPCNCIKATVLDACLLSVLDMLRFFTMNVDFNPLELPFGGGWASFYQFVDIFLSLVAPICTVSVIFSLFKMFFRRLHMTSLSRRPIFYFSSLNEKSFTLAKSVYAQWQEDELDIPKPFIVFCQVDSRNESATELQFSAEAEKMDAIFYEDPIHAIHLPDPTKRQLHLFMMDEDENANIEALLKMEDRLCGETKTADSPAIPKSDILVFSTLESSELLFDKVLENCKKKPVWYYNLRLIDETELIAQKLLLEHPLFEPLYALSNRKRETPAKAVSSGKGNHQPHDPHALSVLVIGGGTLGMEIARTAMLCGVCDHYNFSIQIIDQNGDQLEKQFKHSAPYLYAPDAGVFSTQKKDLQFTPSFHPADVQSSDFDSVLTKYCESCNYIVIATGNDELTISAAQFLQRWYTRQDINRGDAPERPPIILAAIRNPQRHNALRHLETSQLKLFGSNADIFSVENILERPLDYTAAVFNGCYDSLSAAELCSSIDQRRKMHFELLKKSQMDQVSNHMVALHSLYKLQDLLHSGNNIEQDSRLLLDYRHNAGSISSEALFGRLCCLVRDNLDALVPIEHCRWSLYQAINGWMPLPKDMISTCKEAGCQDRGEQDRHKLFTANMHGCIVPLEKLEELSAEVNKLYQKKPDFITYDITMCCASLFAWLDLEAKPKDAEKIREKLLAHLKRKGKTGPIPPRELIEEMAERFSRETPAAV